MSDEKKHNLPQGLPSVLEWTMYAAVGIGTGIAGFASSVRAKFHEKLITMPYFRDLYRDHGAELERINIDYLRKPGVKGATEARAYTDLIRGKKTIFERTLDEMVKTKLGIEGGGLRGLTIGTVQRARTFGNYAGFGAISNAIVAATVGTAGTMMFFNSINTHRKLEMLKENTNDVKSNTATLISVTPDAKATTTDSKIETANDNKSELPDKPKQTHTEKVAAPKSANDNKPESANDNKLEGIEKPKPTHAEKFEHAKEKSHAAGIQH